MLDEMFKKAKEASYVLMSINTDIKDKALA